ncbi:putative polysaccharide biosynthesis protein [Wansuia hejianensis]|uniref:Polysaccharide biosynthesis protein n=1 Tax=Wansuia hejianensis TaxID=2763667 RepID=A0A926II05_9FIRM|nr:polysaccharide biosynthesis protein [Wansuia hejianensis]MBC8591237.1 polysaccharide biosynthesis protein [Wansuia hejianensis]
MSKDNNFIKSAAILSLAGVLVKVLGAVYRIPLGNIIKEEGMGYYQTAYPFYVLLLTISTAGFPVAIAKLVAERKALGDHKGAYKVFKVALIGLSFGGVLTSLFLMANARHIVSYLGNKNAYYSLIALGPALFFVPIMSAFRGLFQGRQNMVPTAVSQISEQFFRVVSGLFLTYYLLDRGIPKAAGGASFGGSIGAIIGTIVIFIIFLFKKKEMEKEVVNSLYKEEYLAKDIVKDLLIIAIPITIGSAITPIMDTIDATLILKRLQSINYSVEQANDLYGQLKGYAQTLINLPQVFSIAIGVGLVPAIAEAQAKGNKREIKKIIESGIRITLLIGLPCAFGLFVLSQPIIGLLFFRNTSEVIQSTGEILRFLSFGVIFLTLVQTLTAMFQGLGRPLIPVINLFIGAILKIVLTYNLTTVPSINIKGAAISTVAAYGTAAILDLILLGAISKIRFNHKDIFLKPLISSIGMAIFVKMSYTLLLGILGERLSTIGAILIGVLTYVILLIITGTITDEDMALIPKGDKIAKKIKNFKLLK